jgi:flagellar motor switch protein FliN/FliY
MASVGNASRDHVMRIPVNLRVVLGTVRLTIAQLLDLSNGAVLPLDRKVDDWVDIVVNDRVVARAEVVVVDAATSNFALRIRELSGPRDS